MLQEHDFIESMKCFCVYVKISFVILFVLRLNQWMFQSGCSSYRVVGLDYYTLQLGDLTYCVEVPRIRPLPSRAPGQTLWIQWRIRGGGQNGHVPPIQPFSFAIYFGPHSPHEKTKH